MSDPYGRHTNLCEYCNGKGKIIKDNIVMDCPICRGEGFLVEDLNGKE